MFQSLSSRAPVYMFFKKDIQAVVGEFSRMENPTDIIGKPIIINLPSAVPVVASDLIVTSGGKEYKFLSVPVTKSLFDSGPDGAIICDNRGEFLEAISAFMKSSEHALSEMDYHKEVVSRCGDILLEFDPQKKAEKEQSIEIANLKKSFEDIRSDMTELKGLIKALGRGSKTKEDLS